MTTPSAKLRDDVEDAPLNGFHKFVLLCTTGGTFCEGYILGIIAIALIQIGPALDLSAIWIGAIGAVSLVGSFLGALIAGPLADKFGRRIVFTTILIAYVVLSAAHFWVADPWSLLALRFLIGVTVGADFPVSITLLTEFSPKKQRGTLLSLQYLGWTIGYAASFAVGTALLPVGPDAWRWMLVSAAIPAFITLLMRLRIPETPMWLAARGRLKEAQAIVDRTVGPGYEVKEPQISDDHPRVSIAHMVRSGYGKRLILISVMLSASVTPQFALGTYSPEVYAQLGLENEALAATVSNSFTIVGTLVGMALINRWGRRPLMLNAFAACTIVLALLGIIPNMLGILVVAGFVVYTFINSASGVLSSVYPPELFPTEFRGTAIGLAVSISRIVSAAGTFLFPILIDSLGIQAALLISAAVTASGFIVGWLWAEETKGRPLTETAAIRIPSP